jgi:outer membrane receptor protein involved in Fe transport
MRLKTRLLSFGVMAAVAASLPASALAQVASEQARAMVRLDIPAGPAAQGLNALATQADVQLFYPYKLVAGRSIGAVKGEFTRDEAIQQMAAAAGLTVARNDGKTVTLEDPQGGSAVGSGAEVEGLIVTAQKREENIQDVPIAMSAFSQDALEKSQIAGGPDLMTQIPNMTFTKTNFSGYSIQIRGIGTQAVSATTDAAVAVAFNNTPFIRNRFFEQEFYDLQRVEVLRGPQGTLYGRNATAGVVNIISAKPKFVYEAKLSGDVANYNSTRLEGMVNIPLVEDAVALRLAGAWTKRDGFAINEITGNPIDGRDLWSTRVSLRLAPVDGFFDANLIWEHFEEDDDRLRSGKQLCNTHEVTEVADLPTTHYQRLPAVNALLFAGVQGTFSQGCLPTSLYSPESFQTPNGISLPYYLPLGAIFLPTALDDPYVSRTQSRDLRRIDSTVDPDYRAKSDLAELQISFDLSDTLTLASETAYSADRLFSLQDFNRFNTAPGAWLQAGVVGAGTVGTDILQPGPNGGIFCDPQIGCADRLVLVDLSKADSRHFSQEFRLGSNFDGPFNFSLGANFLRYDTEDKYYVFINSASLISAIVAFNTSGDLPPYVAGETDRRECLRNGAAIRDPNYGYQVAACTYIDPNPIDSLNDLGHNYFLSKNPYKLISYAVFGETYYEVSDNLKLTAGLRWTVDKKEAPRIPSWLLASESIGYTVSDVAEQEWREPTGRLAIDWKPDLSFTDDTLLYASFAHGYKAGGANPPPFVRVFYSSGNDAGLSTADSATRPTTFDPEFVEAFELGAKNTLFDGSVTLNVAGFYYDYKGYQISEIVDRSAFNRNFDAEVWGLEIEADWRPLESLRLGFKGGYENTRLADGSQAIDLMDRTAGREGWVVVKPFPTFASNCILPDWIFVGHGPFAGDTTPVPVSVGNVGGGTGGGCELAYLQGVDPVTGLEYVPNPTVQVPSGGLDRRVNYPGWDPATAPNNGEGFFKDLSGNELPNAPNYTATVTADYTVPLAGDWLMTLHTDFYYQSESWWRIFNTEGYDKLKAYTNLNLSAIFVNEDAGWKVMAYVKNVMDRDSITGAFLNSDDTGLTTNVFLTEPRLYGIRVTKEWTGGSLLGGFGGRHEGPYPFTLELGLQAQRHDAPNEIYRPDFLDTFAPSTDPSDRQEQDFDWGDGRSVKLAYQMPSGWKFSMGARSGEANHSDRTVINGQTIVGCASAAPCPDAGGQVVAVNYGATDLYEREDHEIVDFVVGKSFGIGVLDALSSSTISAGVRYASLESVTDVSIYGIPDWDVPPEYNNIGPNFTPGLPATHHKFNGQLDVSRDFQGVGPTASWEAAIRLLGGEEHGRVDLDWSVTGGVLFGKQRASGAGFERSAYYDEQFKYNPPTPVYTPIVTPFAFSRSENVTVPTLGLGLGLSYKIDRVMVGGGYRWERYFDAIDGGVSEQKSYDRTIDGPYFKLSVGFGG